MLKTQTERAHFYNSVCKRQKTDSIIIIKQKKFKTIFIHLFGMSIGYVIGINSIVDGGKMSNLRARRC